MAEVLALNEKVLQEAVHLPLRNDRDIDNFWEREIRPLFNLAKTGEAPHLPVIGKCRDANNAGGRATPHFRS